MTARTIKSVPKAQKASFVYGSYPDTVHSPRIKPASKSTTFYGKDINEPKKNNLGFGNTGLTGES